MSRIGRPSIDRRRFLEIGAAAALTAALPEAVGAAAHAIRPAGERHARARGPVRLRPQAVIYDERFEAAREFAIAIRSARLPVHAIRGDVTKLWYAWLHPLWKRAPVPIAGLTSYAAMFCLERLAWDRHLRMARCAWPEAEVSSRRGPAECGAMIAGGIEASSLESPQGRAAADGHAASCGGLLYLWLIAPPAQLAALAA